MCDQYGDVCQLCKRGIPHEESATKPRNGEYMRKYHAMDLAIGKHEQEKFEKHYAAHGIHVTHRATPYGDMEPVITSTKQLERMVDSRGFNQLRG